jgi:hypothetical protein
LDGKSEQAVAFSSQTEDQKSSQMMNGLSSLSLGKEKSNYTETTSASLQDEFWHAAPDANHANPRTESNPSRAISRSIASIFSRASVILRDSMDLDGVLFVDAYRSNFGMLVLSSPLYIDLI